MDDSIVCSVHDDMPQAAAQVVNEGLGAANDAAAPMHQVQPLACFARRADAGVTGGVTGGMTGGVIGGAIGRTWGECCELQQLWVEPAQRGRGIGAELVRLFEQRALQRGCRLVYLETFSFQAPAFYAALGYRSALEIGGFGPGFVKHTMLRRLAAEAAPAVLE
jgi:GNAT superfamily N-acetyltransferase